MSTRILAVLTCSAMLSGCGISGIMYTASKNGCTVADQAAAERAALDAGRPVHTASCKDDLAAAKGDQK
jgi:hypothetical protein